MSKLTNLNIKDADKLTQQELTSQNPYITWFGLELFIKYIKNMQNIYNTKQEYKKDFSTSISPMYQQVNDSALDILLNLVI